MPLSSAEKKGSLKSLGVGSLITTPIELDFMGLVRGAG